MTEFVRIRDKAFDATVSRDYAESLEGVEILEDAEAVDYRGRPLDPQLKGERRATPKSSTGNRPVVVSSGVAAEEAKK